MESSKKKVLEQKKAVESLQKLADEYLSGWQRSKADFENYKKQQADWANNVRLSANEEIIQEIIPVVDNFELALVHAPKNSEVKAWSEGIIHTKRQLEEVLNRHNVKKIEVKPGDLFDPQLHDCVSEKALEDEFSCAGEDSKNQKNNLIVESVVRSGYLLGEKILRPAKVTIRQTKITND